MRSLRPAARCWAKRPSRSAIEGSLLRWVGRAGWAPSGCGRWRTAAMSRVQQVQLDDALAILLLLAAENDPRFDRTAARWVGRVLARRRSVALTLAGHSRRSSG